MNDCKVCLGNDTKIEDKVQRYPKATQPKGAMLSSARLMYGREGSLTAVSAVSTFPCITAHSVAMQLGLRSSKKARIFRRTLIAEFTHLALHSCMSERFYLWPWRSLFWIKRVILMASLGNDNYEHNSRSRTLHFEEFSVCCCLVTQSCLTLCDPMDCSSLGSSVPGISEERILEWVTIPFLWDITDPGIKWTHVSCISKRTLYHWTTS